MVYVTPMRVTVDALAPAIEKCSRSLAIAALMPVPPSWPPVPLTSRCEPPAKTPSVPVARLALAVALALVWKTTVPSCDRLFESICVWSTLDVAWPVMSVVPKPVAVQFESAQPPPAAKPFVVRWPRLSKL